MKDDFFSKTKCDRCGGPLGIRTMSMYNTECICQTCKAQERNRPDYQKALDADHAAIKNGDYNFPGIGLDKSGD